MTTTFKMLSDMIVALDDETATMTTTSTNTNSTTTSQLRSQVLKLGASIGQLCAQFLSPHVPLDAASPPRREDNETNSDGEKKEVLHGHGTIATAAATTSATPHPPSSSYWSTPSIHRDNIHVAIAKIFWNLLEISKTANVNLSSSILKKMDLNARKYPVHLCKGSSGKYTKYSNHTGITENNQSMLDISLESAEGEGNRHDPDTLSMSVLDLTKSIREFALERNWSQYHTPRNIVLAMMGEMGELAEIFQWMGDGNNGRDEDLQQGKESWKNQENKDHFEQELADVSIYCLRLADVVGVHDLGAVVCSLIKE